MLDNTIIICSPGMNAGVAVAGGVYRTRQPRPPAFFVSLFLFPLVRMIGGGYAAGGGAVLYPVVAPAL